MKIEEDEQNDFPEDIPFPEYFQKVTVEQLKERFNEYLEVNIEEQYLKNPEFYLSDDVNEKRFYMRVIERGSSDEEPDDEGYRCIFVPFETKRVEDL